MSAVVRSQENSEIIHTRVTLNYKLETLYHNGEPVSHKVMDRHTGKEIQRTEWISEESTLEEHYEDSQNLQILRYDLNGSLISQRYFKKDGDQKGELRLGENEIAALTNYSVSDEELPVLPIDWEAIIFADRNFARDQVVRWSETRDYRVKTEYTSEGLIFRRTVWNKHTGQRLQDEDRIFLQTISKDIILNHRGFIEIYFNTLGKITAIRSWDRQTGRVVPPPDSIPFSFRLEKDHISMDYEQHKNFRQDFFDQHLPSKKVEIKPGESLFPEENQDWELLKSIEMGLYIRPSSKAVINHIGKVRNLKSDVFHLSLDSRPGRYPLEFFWLHHEYSGRFDADITVKNTRFPLGAAISSDYEHFDIMTRKVLFSRTDGELHLRAGLRINSNSMRLRDGSRTLNWEEWSLQPAFGYRLFWYLNPKFEFRTDALMTYFGVGGTETRSIMASTELKHKLKGN
ncbi:MAG: hypothetical protein H3C47_05585, partial [Candidatus Cloacimonetes bacterium]|nr:hypothetical protein [Candidatus Cloacimonadota bacterium]